MSDVPPSSTRLRQAPLSPAQIRGARGMLDWSMAELARSARLSISTIKRMEMAGTQPISDSAFRAVRSAMEGAGLRFLSEAEGCEGVCFDRGRDSSPEVLVRGKGSPRRRALGSLRHGDA